MRLSGYALLSIAALTVAMPAHACLRCMGMSPILVSMCHSDNPPAICALSQQADMDGGSAGMSSAAGQPGEPAATPAGTPAASNERRTSDTPQPLAPAPEFQPFNGEPRP